MPSYLVDIISAMYTNTWCQVRITEGASEEFKVVSGVRQGCVLSPLHFNCFMDRVLREALRMTLGGWRIEYTTTKGLFLSYREKTPCTTDIQNIQYADDLTLVAESASELARAANKKEQVWLSFKDIVLRLNDKHTIDCDLRLTDLHINFAQRLLKQQFPKKNGLRSTSLQERPHSQPTENAMQILHVKGDHWIVAHTKPRGELVYVYDSSYSSVDQKTASMLMINFRCSMLSIRSMRCQKQEGISDCGLFAIAFATSIAHGEDPGSREYCQGRMSSHLTQCFLDKKLVLFP